MQGRSFLDCACNAGGYLFAARRLGAGQCFGFDAPRALDPPGAFPGASIFGARISMRACARWPMCRGSGLKPYDVTLFNGILYLKPVGRTGLKIAADLTKELIIVNTDIFPAKQPRAGAESGEQGRMLMSGVGWYCLVSDRRDGGAPDARLVRFFPMPGCGSSAPRRRDVAGWRSGPRGIRRCSIIMTGIYPQETPGRLRRLTGRLLGRQIGQNEAGRGGSDAGKVQGLRSGCTYRATR